MYLENIFDHLSDFAIEHKVSPENVDQIISEIKDDHPRLASMLRALSRMTLTPTIIHGGIKSNSVPEFIQLTCDVRTLPHQDLDYVKEQLENILADIPGVEFEIDYMAQPNSSPFETEFATQIQKATAKALNIEDIKLLPSISNGFTDSRFTRPLGVTTYGYTGAHPDDNPMLTNSHGTDESVGIKSLINSTRVMLALAYDVLAIK